MEFQLSHHVELLLGSIGVILGLFFASFLLLTNKEYRFANVFLAIYLLAFGLRIGKSLFHNFFEINEEIRTILLSTLLAVGPAVWLYVKSLAKADDKVHRREWVHFFPLLIGVSLSWLIPNDGSSWLFALFYNFLIIHMFVYMLFSLVWLRKEYVNSASKLFPNVWVWLHYFLGINLVFVCCYFLISELVIPYIGMSLLFSAVVIALSVKAFRDLSLFQRPFEKYRQSVLDDTGVREVMDRLKLLMDTEKPYLDPSLNMAQLSDHLGVSSREISQVINQVESLNYSQFISRYRVKEVQRLLREGKHQHLKIAAIAFKCGFNSISSFNSAFKKHTGITAQSYKASLPE